MRRLRSWFGRWSLRARLMAIGLLGVAGALAIGSGILYGVLSFAVSSTIDQQARSSADQVAAMVNAGRLPDPVPISGAELIQIVDGQGRVVGGSVTADRLTPLLRPAELQAAAGGQVVSVPGARAGLSGPLQVAVVTAGPAAARVQVLAAVRTGDAEHSKLVLRRTLLVTFPLMLAAMALIAHRVIGAALRPVESLRAAADRISGAGQADRLPVPRTSDEIHALAITLNSMLDRLQQSRARQRDFVADAAHELRSPLAAIAMQLEVAERLDEAGDLPGQVLPDVQRLAGLVDDLLMLARIDADRRGPARTETVDLAELVRGLAPRYPTAPVTFLGAAGVLVQADPEELRRAVSNLIDNAVRHARTRVEVRVATAAGVAEVRVSDDGDGIPIADRQRVFERFTRLDEARDREAGGSGLGLPIAAELVRRAGGTLTLTDSPFRSGICALIALPRAG